MNTKLTDETMIEFFRNTDQNYKKFFGSEDQYFETQKSEKYFHPIMRDLDYGIMLHNLQFVYPNEEDANKKVAIFDYALLFLQDIVMVEGAEVLFSKHFYDIEWNMFLEYNFAKEDMQYYRDHFIHQIRNGYMGYVLIWEFGFKGLIIKALKDYPNYAISQFIDSCSSGQPDGFIDVVIRKTWFLSAFFHDIGYPIAYSNRSTSKLYQYMPYMTSFLSQKKLSFVEISAKLSSSYLFKVVDSNELEMQYEKDDHGMISALCLLFGYYDNGLIHSLKPADRCAVELAAYSIFAHTRKYRIHSKDKNKSNTFHGRPVFAENPFAFLLRLCDDLQEWQRVYMYVSDNPNTLICSNCMQPLKRNKDKDLYTCSGSGDQCKGMALQKISAFDYKKINYLAVCDDMKIDIFDETITFSLNYNYIKQLEMIPVNLDYFKYRRDDIEKLKQFLPNQALFPKSDVHYFLSNDYKILKLKIVEEFLKGASETEVLFQKYTYNMASKLPQKERKFSEYAFESLQNEILEIIAPDTSVSNTVSEIKEKITKYLDACTKNEVLIKPKSEIENDMEHVLDNIYAYNIIYKMAAGN